MMHQLGREITPDEVQAYRQAGVVHLKSVLNLDAVNLLRRSIDEAVRSLDQSASGYDFSALTRLYECENSDALQGLSSGQHNVLGIADHIRGSGKHLLLDNTSYDGDGRFLVDTAVSTRVRDFRRFILRGASVDIAVALLQTSTVRFLGDQMFVKEPNTRERTAFHQDATYFEIDGNDCCVIWIPVDPVNHENGRMEYVRGSHLDGRLYRPNVFVSQTELPGAEGDVLPDIEGNSEGFDIVSFDAEPGDVIVHHYRTIHGSGGNLSRYQPRRAISLRYCGDDVRVKKRPWAPRQLHHRKVLSDGEPLSGPDFPVVWRCDRINSAAHG